jgi:hypothetical protein
MTALLHPYGDHIHACDDVGRPPTTHMLDSPRREDPLLDRAGNVHSCDNDERKILHLACIEGRAHILDVLLTTCSSMMFCETVRWIPRSDITLRNVPESCWRERPYHLLGSRLRYTL